MPEFFCNLSDCTTPLPHFWEHTVGSGHATLALRADWQAQLRRCHEELGFRYVRFHGLLSDDLGPLIIHDYEPLYSFFNIDRIIDFLLSIGMKPFVELSFMPEGLASGHQTVFHYRANITPPKDHQKWNALITRLIRHLLERYGAGEVRQWFFEVWNEPNLKDFWSKGQREYFELYRATANAIKSVDAALQVGGPATAKSEWIDDFTDFCARQQVPFDFVSTHQYPTDALGTEDDDTLTKLSPSRRGFLRERAQETFRRGRGKPIYYTEWNFSSNPRDPLHDEPVAAAFVVNSILEMNGLVEAFSFWTFSDIFEENYFPSLPFHGGFGLLNLYGIPKPSYRAFELLHRLGTERLPVDGLHETVDAWVVPAEKKLTIMLTNFALPGHSIANEKVHMQLTGASRPGAVTLERVDQAHANPRRLWEKMKAPEYLSAAQVVKLEEASRIRPEKLPWKHGKRQVRIELKLPPQSVAAVTVDFA